MRLAVGADENTPMAEAVLADLQRRRHEVIVFGPLVGEKPLWPSRWPTRPWTLGSAINTSPTQKTTRPFGRSRISKAPAVPAQPEIQ
jgi:hypothetical protein